MYSKNYYSEIKNLIIDNEVYKKVKDYSKNRNDLRTYYEIGKILSEAGKHYGEGIIREYSKKLTIELGKGFTYSSLTRIKKFYLIQKVATMSQYLSWSYEYSIRYLFDMKELYLFSKV